MQAVSAKAPIGIFDSGIGGLTVARAIERQLPNEQLIYFGDTAHFPYGEKSSESIALYSYKIVEFLANEGCKYIVIACNSASAAAYVPLKGLLKNKVCLANVIDPVVEAVSANVTLKKIGIIGTQATINSKTYQNRIKDIDDGITIAAKATPLLAPMIEAGFYNNSVSQEALSAYLSDDIFEGINALILACTHYPLIMPQVNDFFSGQVTIIDSAKAIAEFVQFELEEKGMLNDDKCNNHQFYVSEFTESFKQSTKTFYQKEVDLKHHPIWEL